MKPAGTLLALLLLGLSLASTSATATADSSSSSLTGTGWTEAGPEDLNVNITPFALIVVPVILLTLVYVIFVAANSPQNAKSHYLVDYPASHGQGHGYGKERRNLETLTARVAESVEKKH
jgi:heme/copper-type cytochrome/quinol oxidase subunit 2